MSIAQLKQEFLALPIEARVELAQSLWDSLGDGMSPVDEAAFQAELKRRDSEMDSDPASSYPHDEVMAEAKRRIGC